MSDGEVSSHSRQSENDALWQLTPMGWALLVAAVLLIIVNHYVALEWTVTQWIDREEYGHGFLIPVVAAFLVWQKKNELASIPFVGSWIGLLVVLFGVALNFMGEMATLFVLIQYAFVFTFAGMAISFVGREGLKYIWAPLVLIFLMIPLPNFLYNDLSAKLQLVSSILGVEFIRLFDISVFRDGNIIDLGSYKLQVVEACSGLRYLFPLTTLSFIVAYIFKASFWKRAVIFLSSFPNTKFIKSFRIGVIGVLVEYWGSSMAEGFLHDFEGWVVFMASISILVLEMWLLSKIGRERRPLNEVFALELPEPVRTGRVFNRRSIPPPFVVSFVILVLAVISSPLMDQQRADFIPERKEFFSFPMVLDQWEGKADQLEQIVVNVLGLDDSILASYKNDKGERVGLYAAYYKTQRKGVSTHSPKACMPGGGWVIKDLSQRVIRDVSVNGGPLVVNRAVIERADVKQLVYYWFHNNSRIVTNEYLLKWYLFWDALRLQRTDGALVRLTTFVLPGEDIDDADARLSGFSQTLSTVIADYIPE